MQCNDFNGFLVFFYFTAGLTMAQRIGRQITKQTNRIKQAVSQYNILDKNLNSNLPIKLSLSDAYNVQ